jgi:hypothetical protein
MHRAQLFCCVRNAGITPDAIDVPVERNVVTEVN